MEMLSVGIAKFLYKIVLLIKKAFNKLIVNPIKRSLVSECGKSVYFGNNVKISGWENVHIGNNVVLGPECMFLTTKSEIFIGDNVMFGPRVSVITGDHRTDLVGKFMISVTNDEKLPENDLPVFFSGDNWIGANATILKGVTIGEGAVIAANSLVTKNVPAYSVVAGVPAKVIKMRFTSEQLIKHKQILK